MSAAATREQQLAEWIEVMRPFRDDFLYYAPRGLRILTKGSNLIPFTLNQAQLWIHSKLEQQRLANGGKVRAMVLKGRQQGASTLIEGRYFWRTSMSMGARALVLTHLGDSTDALFGMTKRYYDNAPFPLQPPVDASNAKELWFSGMDSGYVVGTAGSRKGLGRGRTFNLFHGSEFAFWENAADHFAGLGQTVPDRDEHGNVIPTEMIFESTANGVGNMFHQMWTNAVRGYDEAGNPYDYQGIFVPWFWQREYARPADAGLLGRLTGDELDYMQRYRLTLEQMAWRAGKLFGPDFNGDVDLFNQEYPASPLLAFSKVAGDPLILAKHVERAMDQATWVGQGWSPERKARPMGQTGPVIAGLDPAEYGNDASALVLRQGRCVPVPVVRWYKRDPMELVGLVANQLDQWNKAGLPVEAINVDIGGIGSGIASRLAELGFPVNRVGFGERAIKADVYVIRRDEMWGEAKEWLLDATTLLPKDDTLASDLCSPQYTYDSSRRLKLEPKESMRKRGLNSPDSGDAFALTFAVPFAVEQGMGPKGGHDEWRKLRGRR